jgi:hypothetical protein
MTNDTKGYAIGHFAADPINRPPNLCFETGHDLKQKYTISIELAPVAERQERAA